MGSVTRIVIFLFAAAALWSPDACAATLQDVFRQALAGDPMLGSANYLRQAAEGDKDATCGRLWPQIAAPGSYTSYYQDSAGSILSQDSANTNAEIEGQQARIGVALNQTLFDMPKFAACRAARIGIDRGNTSYEMELENLIQRVVQTYTDVLAAQDRLDSAQVALVLHRALLDEADRGFKTKTASRLDLETAKEHFKDAEAEKLAAENVLGIAELRLADIAGMEMPSTELARMKADAALPTPQPADPAYWGDMAEKGNLKLVDSAMSVEAARYGVKEAYGAMWPTVGLFAAHTEYYNDLNRTGAPLSSDDGNFNGDAMGVRMNLPLFAGGSNKGAASAAENRYKAAQRQHEALRREIRLGAREALSGLLSVKAEIEAAEASVQAARTAYDAAKEGVKARTETETDALETRSNLLKAEEKLNLARYAYVLGIVEFWKSIGALSAGSIDEIESWLAQSE